MGDLPSLDLQTLILALEQKFVDFCPVIKEGAVGNGVIFPMWERLVSNQPGR